MIDQILKTIEETEDLPAPSAVALKVMELALEEDFSMDDLAQEITKDLSLSSRVLKVVNSQYYGLSGEVATLKEGVVILGARSVRNLALAASVLGAMENKDDERHQRIIESALCTAVTARLISKWKNLAVDEEAFSSGLLADIGIFILFHCFPKEYSEIFNEAEDHAVALTTVEERILGINHVDAGGKIAERWNLPDTISIPLSCHHAPGSFPGEPGDKLHELCRLTYLGGLAADIFYGWSKSIGISRFQQEVESYYGINTPDSEKLLNAISSEMDSAAAGFQLTGVSTRNYTEILNEANRELGRMNIQYDGMYRELKTAMEELGKKNKELDRLSAELAERNRMLQNLADRDGLTGIYNHRFFKEFLEHQVNQHLRYKRPLSLMMMDIDHFKSFNDTKGHRTGDSILRQLASLLKKSTRKSDLVARYGGEEFVVILPETMLKGAAIIAEKLRRTIEINTFTHEEETDIRVTVSIGVAGFAEGMLTGSAVIEAADQALYSAKRQGRNQVRVKRPPTTEDK